MVVPVLLDRYIVPNNGRVELNIQREFTIHITPDEAQKQVHSWLISEVSCNIGADSPILVLGEDPVWRVPAYLSFARFGRVGIIGDVEVDVKTGEMNNSQDLKSTIENAADELTTRLPAYDPKQLMPHKMPVDKPQAQILQLDEADLVPDDEVDEEEMNGSLLVGLTMPCMPWSLLG